MKAKKIELLSPAGDFKRLQYALAYGAEAVYLGLPQFSLRAKTGFDFKSLSAGLKYAHQQKKKVYITINIFVHEPQLKLLPKFLIGLRKLKFDALIVSDPGVILLVKKYLPQTEIHLSTQANVLNSEAVKFYYQNGVRRIILGREASLADIRMIKKAVPKMQLEVFVQGAMCMSYSGRCYLSAWLSNRSANEGLCTQPCRFNYRLYLEEQLRPGELMPIEEDGKGLYVLNSKDLCLIEYLPELIKAGVDSIKIEGRTKSHYYVAMATKAYADGLSACVKLKGQKLKDKLSDLKKELNKIDNRGYTTGFLLGNEGIDRQNFATSKAKSEWQVVGEVVGQKEQLMEISVHNSIKGGEELELITPTACYKIKGVKVYNVKGEELAEVHGGTDNTYFIKCNNKINYEFGYEFGLLRKKVK